MFIFTSFWWTSSLVKLVHSQGTYWPSVMTSVSSYSTSSMYRRHSAYGTSWQVVIGTCLHTRSVFCSHTYKNNYSSGPSRFRLFAFLTFSNCASHLWHSMSLNLTSPQMDTSWQCWAEWSKGASASAAAARSRRSRSIGVGGSWRRDEGRRWSGRRCVHTL